MTQQRCPHCERVFDDEGMSPYTIGFIKLDPSEPDPPPHIECPSCRRCIRCGTETNHCATCGHIIPWGSDYGDKHCINCRTVWTWDEGFVEVGLEKKVKAQADEIKRLREELAKYKEGCG